MAIDGNASQTAPGHAFRPGTLRGKNFLSLARRDGICRQPPLELLALSC